MNQELEERIKTLIAKEKQHLRIGRTDDEFELLAMNLIKDFIKAGAYIVSIDNELKAACTLDAGDLDETLLVIEKKRTVTHIDEDDGYCD